MLGARAHNRPSGRVLLHLVFDSWWVGVYEGPIPHPASFSPSHIFASAAMSSSNVDAAMSDIYLVVKDALLNLRPEMSRAANDPADADQWV